MNLTWILAVFTHRANWSIVCTSTIIYCFASLSVIEGDNSSTLTVPSSTMSSTANMSIIENPTSTVTVPSFQTTEILSIAFKAMSTTVSTRKLAYILLVILLHSHTVFSILYMLMY